jgi:hypothetical protein
LAPLAQIQSTVSEHCALVASKKPRLRALLRFGIIQPSLAAAQITQSH